MINDLSGPEDAPVVIFLHGVGMDHRTFKKQREAIRERYRTLLIDLPGHGSSSIENYDERYSLLAAECLEGLMDEEGIDKAVFVGQSLGSFISQRFQLKNPERVIVFFEFCFQPICVCDFCHPFGQQGNTNSIIITCYHQAKN